MVNSLLFLGINYCRSAVIYCWVRGNFVFALSRFFSKTHNYRFYLKELAIISKKGILVLEDTVLPLVILIDFIAGGIIFICSVTFFNFVLVVLRRV